MNVLIVEDEIAAARGLRMMLAEVDHEIQVLDHLTTVQETILWLKTHAEPDLIFLDIQLKDGLSFEIFEQVNCLAPIVFCTAFDHYALKAFKLNSIDYLLKPYQKEELSEAIEKFKKISGRGRSVDYQELVRKIRDYKEYRERFLVKAGRSFFHVSSEQIACLYTQERVNFIKTMEGKQYVIDEYLDELERVLDPATFFRVNRQYIVSIGAVDSLEHDHGKYYLHLLNNPEALPVSRSRVSAFKRWLGQTDQPENG